MNGKRKHIVHLTSVHPPFDTRIFRKECWSLVQAGCRVTLVAPHSYNEVVDGVQIKAVPPAGRRLARMTLTAWQVGQVALRLNADLYHFHDSELIPVGLWLRLLGKKVIYDIHEDIPRDLLSRSYLPGWMLRLLSWGVERVENFASHYFSALITATPAIGRRFQHTNSRISIINNFPILDELAYSNNTAWDQRSPTVTYVGTIALERGLAEMVEALAYLPAHVQVRLKLAGEISPPQHRHMVSQLPGWQQVDELGFVDRTEVSRILSCVSAGLVILHPIPGFLESHPTKLFEYMSAGIPVIASDFPLWRQIIETAGCGLLVDPLNPKAIAEAIEYLLSHPAEAEAMGRRGREAVEKKYNWTVEKAKLLQLYEDLLEPANITGK